MKTLARLWIGGFVLLVLAGIAFAALTIRIEPGVWGVKQNLLGGGVLEEDHDSGFGLRVPFVHRWHFLDRRTHFVTFAENDLATDVGLSRPALEIRTKDNNLATYDLSVSYRIIPGRAHRLVMEGKKDIYRDRVVTTVESVMREELAQLASEEIYSTDRRLEVAKEALPMLKTALGEYHVEPERILIRAVRFPEGYEERLQEKQLTYQKRELAEAQKKVEDQRAITETKEAEIAAAEKELRGDWDKRLQDARSTNEVLVAEILAEADVYERTKRAEADASYVTAVAQGELAIQKAEALRNDLRTQALDTVGGRLLLAQRAAENLQFESVTLNSNDPNVPTIIDLDGLVELLVGE